MESNHERQTRTVTSRQQNIKTSETVSDKNSDSQANFSQILRKSSEENNTGEGSDVLVPEPTGINKDEDIKPGAGNETCKGLLMELSAESSITKPKPMFRFLPPSTCFISLVM